MLSGKWRPFCLSLNVLSQAELRSVPSPGQPAKGLGYGDEVQTSHTYTRQLPQHCYSGLNTGGHFYYWGYTKFGYTAKELQLNLS